MTTRPGRICPSWPRRIARATVDPIGRPRMGLRSQLRPGTGAQHSFGTPLGLASSRIVARMNPRQRRGILLLTLAALGLLGVFALVAGYVADVRAEVDPKVR